MLSAEPLAGVCVISTFPERRRRGRKERAQRDAGGSAHLVQDVFGFVKFSEVLYFTSTKQSAWWCVGFAPAR